MTVVDEPPEAFFKECRGLCQPSIKRGTDLCCIARRKFCPEFHGIRFQFRLQRPLNPRGKLPYFPDLKLPPCLTIEEETSKREGIEQFIAEKQPLRCLRVLKRPDYFDALSKAFRGEASRQPLTGRRPRIHDSIFHTRNARSPQRSQNIKRQLPVVGTLLDDDKGSPRIKMGTPNGCYLFREEKTEGLTYGNAGVEVPFSTYLSCLRRSVISMSFIV